MKRTSKERRAAWISWAVLLLLLALVPTRAAAQAPKPLTMQGVLKDSDPLDRLRKQSHQRVHEVKLQKDQVYLIELRSFDFDTFLRIEDAKGRALADNNDLAPGNTNSRLGFVPSATAKYRLIVTSFTGQQTGEYVLQLWPLQPTAEAETIEGKLTKDAPQVEKRHTQVHKAQVQAERWYLIDLISKEFDPYLVLHDGQGKGLAQDNDSGGDLNARLLWFSEKKDEWLVRAITYVPGATGAYTLRWRPYQGSPQPDLTERERWAQQAGGLERRSAYLYNAGKPAEAVESYQQAILLYEKVYPKNKYPRGHPQLARSLNNLGFLLQVQGDHVKALAHYEQALAMYQQLYPKGQYPQGHSELATSLHNLGGLRKAQKEYAKALAFYEQALAMYQQLYPKGQYPQGHPDLARSLNNLGALLQDQGEYAKALPYLEQALAGYRGLGQRFAAFVPEAEALRFLNSAPQTLDSYLSIPSAQARSAEATYAQVWHSKGLLTRLLQRRHQAARIALAGPGPARQKWAQLLDARHQLGRLLLEPIQDGAARDKELARLTDLKEGLERDLSKLLPEIERTKEMADLGPTDLAHLLPKDAAFIDLVRYVHFGKGKTRSNRYLAFVVLPDKTIKRIDLKGAEPIEMAVQAWLWYIARGRDSAADAARVGQLVWAPLAKVLPANTKTVYLAPDRELGRLPWPALPGKKAGAILLEDLAVAVVPHGPFLLEQLKYPPDYAKGSNAVLALGDVDYGPVVPKGYAALKGTGAELKQVVSLAGKRDLRILVKDKATWDDLKEALPKVRYAHLATHGFFDARALVQELARAANQRHDWQAGQTTKETGFGDRSPLSYSGLVLAGANDPKQVADGVVLGESLVNLPLEGLELCVLSACETSLGGYVAGEGVQGLPRAFHLAGCRNVVASLWSVNDQATAALMARFYHELWTNGQTPLEALRQAQLTIYRHPERIADLANRERPNFHKTVALPPDVTPQGAKRTPTRLWAAFQVSGVGQ